MAYSSILSLVDLYTSQRNSLEAQDSDILMEITEASRKTATLATTTEAKKKTVQEEYDTDSSDSGVQATDSTEYQAALQDVEDEYELKLSQINSWEKELDLKKEDIESQVQQVEAYLESYNSVLKQNVQTSYKFAQSSQ